LSSQLVDRDRGALVGTTLVLIPVGFSAQLVEALIECFAQDGVLAVADDRSGRERRWRSRRGRSDRVRADVRRISSSGGRRIGDRRVRPLPVEAPPLPSFAAAFADELVFVLRTGGGEWARDLEAGWLMLRVQAGDPGAAAELYRMLIADVVGAAERVLGDRDEAQDVAHDVFETLDRLATGFDSARGSAAGLLVVAARNRALDRLRRLRRAELEEPWTVAERSEAAVELVSGVLEQDDLRALVQALPLLARQVMWLRYVLDLPLAEIAGVLGRDHAHVRQVHRRALRALTSAA